MAAKTAVFLIYKSDDGKDNWQLVKPDDVPEWLKKPDVMGRLELGFAAQNTNGIIAPDAARPWYRGERVSPTDKDQQRVIAAIKKRQRRADKARAVMH